VARLMLFGAFLLVGFEAFVLIAAPGTCMCPMRSEPPLLVQWLVPAVGFGMQAIGLAWMIRICRADPEGRSSSFRAARR
jgi:hypothetical protein